MQFQNLCVIKEILSISGKIGLIGALVAIVFACGAQQQDVADPSQPQSEAAVEADTQEESPPVASEDEENFGDTALIEDESPASESVGLESSDRYMHRFLVARGRSGDRGEFLIETQPAPGKNVVSLLSYDGILSLNNRQYNGGYRSFAVVRFDETGHVRWVFSDPISEENEGTEPGRFANSVEVTSHDNIIVGGAFREHGAGFSLLKLSGSGHEIWRVEPTRGIHWSEIYDIDSDSDGNIYVVGHFTNRLRIRGLPDLRGGRSCGFVAKFNGETGHPMWARHLRSPESALVDVQVTGENDVIVGGHYSRVAKMGEIRLGRIRNTGVALARVSSDGSIQWAKQYGEAVRGGPGNHLVRLVGLTEGRIVFQSRQEVMVVSEEDGEIEWQQNLESGQFLVESSRRRNQFWLSHIIEVNPEITEFSFASYDTTGVSTEVGSIFTETYELHGHMRAILAGSSILLSGTVSERRWDVYDSTPFFVLTPFGSIFDGARFDEIPQRGPESRSRCSRTLPPVTPDFLELRAGFESIEPEILSCGINPRNLRSEVVISNEGFVEQINLQNSLSFHQQLCVQNALRQARFCPFQRENYTLETPIL